MNKIILIGSGGSGKSKLARKLGECLNIQVYHLDRLFWKPGWIAVPKDEQRKVQRELVRRDRWIIDGNYGGTMDIRINAADTIIFLDMPRWVCVYRVFKRWWQYRKKTRPDMGAGKERINFAFLKWVWHYPKDKKPGILKRLEQLPEEKTIIVLKSTKDVRKLLNMVREGNLDITRSDF